jgi:hypothetical protein
MSLAAIHLREEPDANERPSETVRGAPGDRCPYRDRHLTRKSQVPVKRRLPS